VVDYLQKYCYVETTFDLLIYAAQEAANVTVRKKDLKIRDRSLRLTHAKPVDTTPKKTMEAQKKKRVPKHKEISTPGSKSNEGGDKAKRKASALSYQGLRSSKSGAVKKVKVNQRPSNPVKQSKTNEAGGSARKGKRPAVAARKVKELAKKRKLDASTPENTHRSKKARK
jgi:nucleolar protein 12